MARIEEESMVRYRNKKTGAVIETAVNIRGEDWVEIPVAPPVRAKKPEPVIASTEPVLDKPKKTRRRRAAKS